MTSYYDILEVNKNASESEIKKAFRQKSLHLHPDKNGGDDTQFKEIGQAYETLSDSRRRRQYDLEEQLNNNPFGMFAGMPMRGSHMESGPNGDLNDIFSSLFGNPLANPMFHQGHQKMEMPGVHIFRGEIPIEQLFNRAKEKCNIKPEIIQISLNITFEQAYSGCSLPVTINRWTMIGDTKIYEEETIYVDVYEGIDENEIICYKEKGNINEFEQKGDVKVCINIEKHSHFERNGIDLIYKKTISLKEALCGFSFDILHINNKKLAFNNKTNPTMVKPSYRKKIPNLGFKRMNKTGNLIVVFDVVFPEQLTKEQIESLNTIL